MVEGGWKGGRTVKDAAEAKEHHLVGSKASSPEKMRARVGVFAGSEAVGGGLAMGDLRGSLKPEL